MTRVPFCLFLTLALTLALSTAADWPRFRGPNGTGDAEGALPDVDPDKISLVGQSMGGYYGGRGAAKDSGTTGMFSR